MDATNMGGRSVNVALTVERKQVRPDVSNLPVPLGYTRAHLERGDKVFHGEIARGQCAVCHGIDAKGTENGNDLTTGMYIWAEATVGGLKKVLLHNMSVAPGMDGDLTPADTEAVAAYIWALGRQTRLGAN
jgi:mono/diheme cytochrome c family protein